MQQQGNTAQYGGNRAIPIGMELIVRKTEKLTTALYMVSDIIPDRDPIKWKVRETCIELLSDITLSTTGTPADRIVLLKNSMRQIEKISSLLDVAWTTRLVSEMNAELLRREFLALHDAIRLEMDALLRGEANFDAIKTMKLPGGSGVRTVKPLQNRFIPEFKEESRERPLHPQVAHTTPRIEGVTPASHLKPITNNDHGAIRESARVDGSTLATNVSRSAQREEAVRDEGGNDTRIPKDDRKKIILALLKQQPSLTVKDIVKSIQGFSEKTIQRELGALTEDGLVSKTGEKRWTTYSITQGH